LYYHVEQLAFIGFVEVIRHLRFFLQVFNHLFDEMIRRRPDILVLVDYPGFNLRFASKAKKAGIKTFYYITPQVWAWNQDRAKKMATFIDHMAVIFEFEVPFFKRYGNRVTFVGHPLLDIFKVRQSKKHYYTEHKLNPGKPVLALLPGSRRQEIDSLLPTMLETARVLRSEHPELQVTVSQAPTITTSQLASYTDPYKWIKIVKNFSYEQTRYATAAIVASGTATLEAALTETPFVVAYRVSVLSYHIMKHLIKIPFIGLVNVVGAEEIAPEFVQNQFQVHRLKPVIEGFLFNPHLRAAQKAKLKTIRPKLGSAGAAQRTAQLVLQNARTKVSLKKCN
jgi:lipid-A-disaccharide synthase